MMLVLDFLNTVHSPHVDSIPNPAFDHPNLVFSVNQLDDAFHEQCVEKVPHNSGFRRIRTGENEARNRRRLVDKVPKALLLPNGRFSTSGQLPRPKSTVYMVNRISTKM